MGASMPGSGGDEGSSNAWQESQDTLTPILRANWGQGQNPISDEDWQHLRSVARQLGASGCSFSEFVVAIIAELLRLRLPASVLAHTSLDRMSQTIGATLCGDPSSKQRLILLQEQLLKD